MYGKPATSTGKAVQCGSIRGFAWLGLAVLLGSLLRVLLCPTASVLAFYIHRPSDLAP